MAFAGGQQAAADPLAHRVVGLAETHVDVAHAGADLLEHAVIGVSRVIGAATRGCRSDRHMLVVVGRMQAAILGVVEVVQARWRGRVVVIEPARPVAAQVQPFHFDQVLLQAQTRHVGGDSRCAAPAGPCAVLGSEDLLPGPGAVVVGVVRGRPGAAGQVPMLADAHRPLAGLRVGRRGAVEIMLPHRGDVGRGLGQGAVGVEGEAGFGDCLDE